MSEQEFKAMLKDIGYSDYAIEMIWSTHPEDISSMSAKELREDAEMLFCPYYAKLQNPNKNYMLMPKLVYPSLGIGLS